MNRPARLVVCMLIGLTAGILYADKPTKTLTGKVKGAEKYNGKIITVFIADPNEGDFLVARGTDIGKELLQHVGSLVKVTGYVKKPRPGSDYTQVIDVLTYEIEPTKVETDGSGGSFR